mmetsp:Transcript_26614/g.77459  ORF Transcript_26614/g.77459 Transcript_26614/m.77459 type:complete len:363 (-) Transcript_26614:198-1286(-)
MVGLAAGLLFLTAVRRTSSHTPSTLVSPPSLAACLPGDDSDCASLKSQNASARVPAVDGTGLVDGISGTSGLTSCDEPLRQTKKDFTPNEVKGPWPMAASVHGLGLRRLIAGDVLAAFGAALAVSPFVCVIDKAVVQAAAGSNLPTALMNNLQSLVLHPGTFVRRPEFIMIVLVYVATYSAANTITTICERVKVDDDLPKLIGVSATSIMACLLKDRALARMFGLGQPRSVPFATYQCFVARDAIGAAAAFNIPKRFSAQLQHRGMAKRKADTIAQLATPAAMEIICTPFHFLGFNIYNQPGLSAMERLSQIFSFSCLQLTLVRMVRVTPAFGIGGVVNTRIRQQLRSSKHLDKAITAKPLL